MRKLQQDNEEVFGTKLQITRHFRFGGQRLFAALLAVFWGVVTLHAQSASDAFLSALGELREAPFADKESIVERLSQSGHSSVRAVLTAFLEDRLYFRNDDQKVVIVKSTEGDPASFELVDPLSLKDSGTAPADS